MANEFTAILAVVERLAAVPPRPFNVNVDVLSKGFAASVRRAIDSGFLDSCNWGGYLYVIRRDLEDTCGPGSDTMDPEGPCYIPDDALVDHETADLERASFFADYPGVAG